MCMIGRPPQLKLNIGKQTMAGQFSYFMHYEPFHKNKFSLSYILILCNLYCMMMSLMTINVLDE